MNILGFIPARGGSKGIPNKNIKLLAGKPLIAYTIEQALLSKINKIFISTDSPDIANIANDYKLKPSFLRPHEFGQDDSIIEDALQYVLQRLKSEKNYQPDIIVLLQPTSPLRTYKNINESIELLIDKKADTVISVSEPMEHPGDMIFWDSNGKLHFLLETILIQGQGKTQRQQFPQCYFINGSVYTFTYQSFKTTGSRFGEKTIPLLMRQIDSIDIDTIDDFYIAEMILKNKKPDL